MRNTDAPPAYTTSAQPQANGSTTRSTANRKALANGHLKRSRDEHEKSIWDGRSLASTLPKQKDLTTDRNRWRLVDEEGRQTWKYLRTDKEMEAWPQNKATKYHLGMDTGAPQLKAARTPLDAAENALSFFEPLQLPSGQWACEYGGPMFLLPGLVITWYVTNTPIPSEFRIEIANYLFARQNKEDYGWGLHIEGKSSVFGTAMNYTVLRLVGVEADDSRMINARNRLHEMGGAVNGPHWTKFWLSVLGVYEWEGVNPVPPELWYTSLLLITPILNPHH